MRTARHVAWALALLLAGACSNVGEDRTVAISSTGSVAGQVYLDADGTQSLTAPDQALTGVRVRLIAAGGLGDTVAATLSGTSGRYVFRDVPTGMYVVRVDTTTIGDSVRVGKIDSTTVTVLPSDSSTVNVGITFPLVSLTQARGLPSGRTVFVVGVATSGASDFVDSTAHFVDNTAAIRLAHIRVTFNAGDSLRVSATTGRRQGLPTLEDPSAFGLGSGTIPHPDTLTSASAATAVGGSRDARLAIVRGVTVIDTARTATAFVLTVSDGSGNLEVQLDRTADAAFQAAALPGAFIPGARFDVTGELAPQGGGAWRVRPRSAADIVEIPPPVISIAAARALPPGTRVTVIGVALNTSTTFADTTVHLSSGSTAIRMTRLRNGIAAGDSVRVRATTAVRNGGPVLDDVTSVLLGHGFLSAASNVTTQVAATASGGTLDAQAVIVHGATVTDTARTTTSFLLTVNDGSGPLVVQLDRTADAAFQPAVLPGPYVPGSRFDVTGLLAPNGSGAWVLKPRSAAELTEIPLTVISIAAARALPAGRTVLVVGVALNGSANFADTTVHLADTSGAIRLTRLRTPIAAAGDSVRVRATTSSRNGQPTLDDVTAVVLGNGFAPTAPTLTTAAAATASGGARDAALVIVRGAIITDTARTTTSFLLTVSDSSGPLVVQLDRNADAAFQPGALPGPYIPGSKFDVTGLLAASSPGVWRLKPRGAGELTEIPLPVISIRAARGLPAGRSVIVVGVALNTSATFSDTTVHLADTSGTIRLTRLRTPVNAIGDSVRVRATTSSRNGQPTLDDVTATVLGTGLIPTAPNLTTATAATASGGTIDAALVVVHNALIADTATVAGNFRLHVTDGTGLLEVLLDRKADAAFQAAQLPGLFIPGNRFDIIGLLQPIGGGAWRLKPRSAADMTKQ